MEKQRNKKVYFNPGQRELMYIGANTETIIAARRFGKSDGIIAPRLLRDAQAMPRSAGAIYAATFQQALSRTLPAAVHALTRWGYKHERHYFIGRKAPKSADFKLPHIEPQSWDHVMHWYNGRIEHILSQDVKFSANSLTLDGLKIDEGRSINQDKLTDEVIPAVSGMIGYYKNCPWHKGITIVSDMPQGKKGDWILKRKSQMDLELIQTIKDTQREIVRLKKLNSSYAKNMLAYHQKQLVFARKHAHIYREFDSIDNLELLGEAYIKKMKRELTPLVFQTSIMNRRILKLANGFYANLSDKLHYYDAFDNEYLDNQRTRYGSLDIGNYKSHSYFQDTDVDKTQHLSIAFDYNANINWVVCAQAHENEARTIKSMFVKNERKIREVVNDWCDYYIHHPVKHVVYYYNETALQGAYASDTETFADMVQDELRKRGWMVEAIYMGKPMKHALKHQYINDGLTGIKYLFPTFNRHNNEFLIPAMEQTGIKVGRNGFEKDKSGEKLKDTDEDPLELRTDGTDAWDDLWIGLNFFPFKGYSSMGHGNIYLGN
jgi:hypothetical protein